MPEPTITETAEELYESLGPWYRSDGEVTGWALKHLVEAVTRPLHAVNELVRDTDEYPGWSTLMDVDVVPSEYLPWLAQFVGVGVQRSFPIEDQREQVKDSSGFKRGRPRAITNALRPYLTNDPKIILHERIDGEAYRFQIDVYASQVRDGVTEGDMIAAVNRHKPAGLVWNLTILPGITWGDADTEWSEWGPMADTGTWDDAISTVPGGA